MDELFQHIEARIHALSKKYAHLKKNNDQLLKEKKQLLSRQKDAILQIETMIARLKSIEEMS